MWAGDALVCPAEVSEEELVMVASGLRISQLLVMKWAPMYVAETGVLAGMLGGDVVEKTEAEVVGWFSWDEVKVDIFELSPQ